MDAFPIGFLASLPVLFSIAIGLFLVLVRSPWPWTRAGGYAMLVITAVALVPILRDETLRATVLTSERLPILLLAVASCAATWLAFRQALGGAATESSAAAARGRAWPPPGGAELLLGGAAVVTLATLAFFLGAPLAPMADPSRPADSLTAPWFMLGLQELSAFFDPWVASVLLPMLTVLGLLALPYLDAPAVPGAEQASPDHFEERRDVVYFFLFVWFFVALFPMVAALFQVSSVSAGPAMARPLSEAVWDLALNVPPRQVWLRELPALVALGLYFAVLPRQLTRWKITRALFGRYVRRLGPRRFHLAMALMQLWMLVPLKMYCFWLLGVGYFVYLPEIGFNF